MGNGILKGLLPKLLEEGWDDVPTLKLMSSEDMDAIQMTQQQKVCLFHHLSNSIILNEKHKKISNNHSIFDVLSLFRM